MTVWTERDERILAGDLTELGNPASMPVIRPAVPLDEHVEDDGHPLLEGFALGAVVLIAGAIIAWVGMLMLMDVVRAVIFT